MDRLLIIDDELQLGKFVAKVGSMAGYESVYTDQTDEFRRRLAEWSPSVVVIDLQMPGTDGIELLREMSEMNYRAPAILLTGQGSYEVDVEAMQAGATLYLTKSEANPLLLERTIGYANHLGLFSEDVDPTDGSMWGNFPQAYSHVGLINAVDRFDVDLVIDMSGLQTRRVDMQQVDKVNQPGRIQAPDAPVPAASPAQLRLIVHVDQGGNARLLQKVLQMFKNGTLKPDPIDPTKKIVDQPGRYVLVTADAFIPTFLGATLRDGQPVAHRFSSAAFGFSQPVLFSAAGEFGAGKFNCQLALDYDHPLNPFKHKYHPDHDNLNARFDGPAAESFTVTRQLQLQLAAAPPPGRAVPDYGYDEFGGNYSEVITGLHKNPIHVAGTFRLRRAAYIAELNPSPTP